LGEVDLFSHPGWKTQNILDAELKHFKVENEHPLFNGFGNCVPQNITLDSLKDISDVRKQMEAYLGPLRAQCSEPLVQILVDLVKNGGLSIDHMPNMTQFYKISRSWKIL